MTETTHVCIWKSLIFLLLKCSEIDHPHHFLTDSLGTHALIYLRRAETAVKSAKRVLLTADDVDLALLSVGNTPPAGHTYSPAQCLFGRVLRSDLPQTADALEPATPPRDTVVQEHINEPTTYGLVFLSRIFNPGHLCVCQTTPDVVVQSLDSRGNRRSCRSSTLHDNSRGRTLCRNRVQIQQAPSTGRDCQNSTPSAPVLPDLLVPNTMTAQHPNNTPREIQRNSPTLIQPMQMRNQSFPPLLCSPFLKIGRYNYNSLIWNLSCLQLSLRSHPAHQHGVNY